MRKIFLIGFKDLKLAFRDRAALIMMLLAPFALTLGMGFVTGRFSGANNSGLNNIPVVLVNQDGGELGNALVDLFKSPELNGLAAPSVASDPADARQMVDENKAAAAVIIPAGFTNSIIPTNGQTVGATVQLELYANPTAPTSVGVVKTILDEYLSQVEVGRVGGQVAVEQLLRGGLAQPADAAKLGEKIGWQSSQRTSNPAITIHTVTNSGEAIQFDILAYMAPGMALMFLMYTTSYGGRVLLAERNLGTLPRLLVSPTTSAQVLGGKVLGTFFTGAAQMFILILASTLFFSLKWGDPLGIVVLVLAAVFAACGWGLLITAIARTPGQASWIGTAIMLLFGMLGGSFINLGNMPGWFRMVSQITPNAWGLDGFSTLAQGGTLADIVPSLMALVAMGALLFGVALFLFRRNNILQN
jgi:ABC-2 type transport system permease protein